MLERKPVFPNIIEVNHQLGHVLGCNVYLIFDGDQWVMIDIGYEEVSKRSSIWFANWIFLFRIARH